MRYDALRCFHGAPIHEGDFWSIIDCRDSRGPGFRTYDQAVRVLLLVLVACGGTSTNAQLVAWYRFDDLVAGRVTDASGNNHDGACTSCPSLEAGKLGSAFRFNGGDQQIDVPPNPAFATTRGLSAAAWVKLDAAP